MGRRLALLIATYQYQDTGLRQLTAPAHDAEALAAVLRNPDIAGFEVTILINEPHHRVGEAIGDFYRDRRRDDLTLLYFTGHGLKDDDGRLYLAMSNTRRDSLLFTSLSAEHIDQAMESCPSRQKVLILDCCYSGAYPAGRLAKADTEVHALERFHGRGRTVLTASDATQYSFEGSQPHGNAPQSVFTRYLVAGLRDGSADLDGDGDITLDELYSFVHDRVVEELPQQRPKRQDNVEGRTVVARNINWSLPAYLRHAISSPIATDRLGALDSLAHLHQIGNDTVRASVHQEIQRLAEDDSRRVSTTAAALLQSIHPRLPEPTPEPPPTKQTPDLSQPMPDKTSSPPLAQPTPPPSPQPSPPIPATWIRPPPTGLSSARPPHRASQMPSEPPTTGPRQVTPTAAQPAPFTSPPTGPPITSSPRGPGPIHPNPPPARRQPNPAHGNAIRINVTAILAMAMTFVFPLIGILIAHVARWEANRNGGSGRGLATASVVLSYTVTGIGLLIIVFGIAGMR
jgi:hypothetical protein